MNLWNQVPVLRLLLPFIAGIITAVYFPDDWRTKFDVISLAILLLFAFTATYVFIKRLQVNYLVAPLYGFLMLLLIFCCGFQLTNLKTEKFNRDHFSNYKGGMYIARCTEPSFEKERSYKVVLEVLAVRVDGAWKNSSGKAVCYFKKDSLSAGLGYGDCMLISAEFNTVKPPQNPGEFNYRQFLSFHNIYHQAYIAPEKWRRLNVNIGNAVIRYAHESRANLLSIFRENNVTGQEFAVGSALVLGYDDKVDQDLISAYASSGALHVLSVSGLHVGIIYVVANFLLMFLDKFRNGTLLKVFLLLLILWAYATLTGLSPSVLRSAAMFSLIVVAKGLKYDTNIFNTLAVACFALLLFDPYFIMQVGFQLSFLAVLGIVGIQPWLYDKWRPQSRFVNYVWVVVSVSIAAQAATFPLGLLYFHQFPNYFLFSNLIVIPVSTVILIYGLFVLLVGKIAVVGPFCAKLFSWMVWLLNESVRITDRIPGALLEGISISIAETWVIYALILCLIIYLFYGNKKYFICGLVLLMALLFFQGYENYRERNQRLLVVYNTPKATAINLISGKKNWLIADTLLLRNKSRMLFHIKHHIWDSGIEDEKHLGRETTDRFSSDHFAVKDNFIQFGNRMLALVDKPLPPWMELSKKFPADYVVLTRNAGVRIKDLHRFFSFKKVIIDASNSEWKNKKWKEECEELKVNYYSVIDSGAYVEELL